MLSVIRFIRGYLTIKVCGFSPERFMNLCSNHNILLWEILNHEDFYTMNISLKGFYKLRPIVKKTGTRVAITKRCGLPFFLKRIKKRKIFISGLIGSLLFWIWMSGFIWSIDISGNHYITTDILQDFMVTNQITPGIKKNSINIEMLERAIRTEFPIVTWTSMRIDGTRLVVQIKENNLYAIEQQKQNNEEGMDLTAPKDGYVVSIVTRAGIPKVKTGDSVIQGDILVEGAVPILNEDSSISHYNFCVADADVMLQSVYSFQDSIDENYQQKKYTTKAKTGFYIMLHTFQLEMPQILVRYNQYDQLEEIRQWKLFENYFLPVYTGKITKKEYILEEKKYNQDEVKQLFEKKILKYIETLEEKGVQIIEKNVTINKTAGVWQMKADFLVIEKAGILKRTHINQIEE